MHAKSLHLLAPKPCTSCGKPTRVARYKKWARARKVCDDCWRNLAPRKHLKDRCEFCGFVPAVPQQLHVDHRRPRSQGGSNAPENLQTLCANCHALKTYIERL